MARDLTTALIGLWIVTGIYIDGWAHVHILESVQNEGFFTPWHASFYSGVLVFAAWMGWQLLRVRVRGEHALQTFMRLPTGYRGGTIGVAIFMAGGAVDFLWHTLLGIEASIDALLSPPHLVLLSGALLMGTTAWRSASSRWAEVISLASVVALAAFFLNFLSPYRWSLPSTRFVPYTGEDQVVMWVGGLLVTTAIILIPVLWQLRDNRYSAGTLTVLTVASGLGVVVSMSDHWGMNVLVPGLIAAVLGAFASDMFISYGPWRGWRYGLPLVGAGTTFVIWTAQLIAYAATAGLKWPASLWGGSLLFATAAGAAYASLSWNPARGKPSPADREEVTRLTVKSPA